MKRSVIMVSNDDGHQSDGLRALVEAVLPLGEVWVVAPETEQSAAAHAISLHRPLRIREVRERWYAVDGTPTDCSYVGINHILKGGRPDLVLSGINHGPNLANDVTYSGTVAAAMEATILGVPSIAFSLATRRQFDFAAAARFAGAFVAAALRQPLPPGLLLNVNVPAGVEPDGYVIAGLGKHSYGADVIEKEDPRGRKYYWIGSQAGWRDVPRSDCNAVFDEGLVAVTPLHLDLTHDGLLARMAGFSLPGYRKEPDP